MKELKINKPKNVVILDTDMPKRKKGEALLKMLYGGICGSDLGAYRGTFAYFSYPRTPGHELSMQIVDIDENDLGLEKGMIVTANPYFNCGECYSCHNNRLNVCMHNETMGVQREGGFSQFITLPIERLYDSKGLDPKVLAVIEPFCISYHGVKRANVQKGENVLILGAGTIGILAAISALAKGANVWVADVSEGKLEIAKTFGINGTILNDTNESFIKQVNEITNNNGFDVTIEAVGLPSTFQNCIDAACFGGRMVLIGIGKQNLDFNFTIIQKKELSIFGSRNALKEDFIELIDLVKSGKISLEKVITNTYKFEDAQQAFSDFDKNSGDMLKVILDFT